MHSTFNINDDAGASSSVRYRQTDKQTDIQTDRQTYVHTDRQTDSQTDIQTYRQTDRQTNKRRVGWVVVVIEVVTERHYLRASLYTVFRVLLTGANTVIDLAVPTVGDVEHSVGVCWDTENEAHL